MTGGSDGVSLPDLAVGEVQLTSKATFSASDRDISTNEAVSFFLSF